MVKNEFMRGLEQAVEGKQDFYLDRWKLKLYLVINEYSGCFENGGRELKDLVYDPDSGETLSLTEYVKTYSNDLLMSSVRLVRLKGIVWKDFMTKGLGKLGKELRKCEEGDTRAVVFPAARKTWIMHEFPVACRVPEEPRTTILDDTGDFIHVQLLTMFLEEYYGKQAQEP